MSSLAKRGYGGYGYSKPQMNYHRQNSDSVTTVVTEMNRMTVNEKPPCYGAAGAVQKHAEEEVYEEDDVVYSGGHHGGGATVQKLAFREDEVFEKEQVLYPPVHHGGAVQKQEYRKEVYQQKGGGGTGGYTPGRRVCGMQRQRQRHSYAGGHEAYHHGVVDGGYALQHGGAAQKYGYGQKAYQQHAAADVGGYDLSHHDSAVHKKNGYGVYGGAAQNHGYGIHDSAVQKHDGYGVYGGVVQNQGYGYGIDGSAVQKHGYGPRLHGGAVQKHGAYGHEVYQQVGDVGAYDRAVMQKHAAVGGGGYALHHGGESSGLYGKAYSKHDVAGGHHVGAGDLTHQYNKVEHESESEDESDCSSEEESDCEEEYAHGRNHDGGVQVYQPAYNHVVKHGGSHNLVGGAGARHHEAYERRSDQGSGTHYASYESTTTEGYSGGGGYGGWAQRKNRCQT